MIRIDCIKAVSRNLRDLVADATPASLAASHVDVAELVQVANNVLQGSDFYIYSGAGAGQRRTVTAFTPANNRLIFNQTFTTIPSTNSNFIVFRQFTKDEYDHALDRFIALGAMQFLEEKVATLELIGTQYEYPVPSGWEYLHSIRLVPSGPSNYSDYDIDDEVQRHFEFSAKLYKINPNPLGSWVISFDARKIDMDNFNAQMVRVMGQAKPSVLATDSGTLPLGMEEYVIAGASMLLSSTRMDEGAQWKDKFAMFRLQYQELEGYIYKPKRGKRVN